MSADEREELIGYLRGIKGFLNWVGGGVLVAILTVAWFILTDHFGQIKLREEMDYVKPKVEQLWWRSKPDASVDMREDSRTAGL